MNLGQLSTNLGPNLKYKLYIVWNQMALYASNKMLLYFNNIVVEYKEFKLNLFGVV